MQGSQLQMFKYICNFFLLLLQQFIIIPYFFIRCIPLFFHVKRNIRRRSTFSELFPIHFLTIHHIRTGNYLIGVQAQLMDFEQFNKDHHSRKSSSASSSPSLIDCSTTLPGESTTAGEQWRRRPNNTPLSAVRRRPIRTACRRSSGARRTRPGKKGRCYFTRHELRRVCRSPVPIAGTETT